MRPESRFDLEVMGSRLSAIAEEMGVVLARTGYSPNVKERQDFSCAIFDRRAALVAQAAHIPVHLASTSLSVRAAVERLDLGPGDVAIVNDPFAGGTHLPDVTLVAPVYRPGDPKPFAYVANRAHHADVGGSTPGSMGLATEIYQEGLRIPPVRLVRHGELDREILALFLANARVAEEREGDLRAQLAALALGRTRLFELAEAVGPRRLERAMAALQDYSERLLVATLRTLRPGTYRASDWLDDDGFTGPHRIQVAVGIRRGRAVVDFSGSASQVRGSLNANYAITLSAVFYAMKCLAPEDVPANDGLLRPVRLVAPEGSIVNARPPAAVAGGNVETSQRIVDVLLRALARAAPDRIPAASSGSMSNLTIGGFDPFRKRAFSYYETIAGGAGAAPGRAGTSGIHTHMTNTRNTPIEALEAYYPLRVTEYRIRRGSGGAGRFRGGDGLIREIECLVDAEVSVLSERRTRGPWGLRGGGAGKPGANWILVDGRRERAPGKFHRRLPAGARVRLETPGGGGFGRPRPPSGPSKARAGLRVPPRAGP
jgi:N-methylhydantoinase B